MPSWDNAFSLSLRLRLAMRLELEFRDMPEVWVSIVRLAVEGSGFLRGQRLSPPDERRVRAEFVVPLYGVVSAPEFLQWLRARGVASVILWVVLEEGERRFAIDCGDGVLWMPRTFTRWERPTHESPVCRYRVGSGAREGSELDGAWEAFEDMARGMLERCDENAPTTHRVAADVVSILSGAALPESAAVELDLVSDSRRRRLMAAALAMQPLRGSGSITDEYQGDSYDHVEAVTVEALAASTRV